MICKKRGISVDVDTLKPHNLRRTYGTEHDTGNELKVICELLGRSSMDTTRTYIYDDTDVKKKRAMLKTRLVQNILWRGIKGSEVMCPSPQKHFKGKWPVPSLTSIR
jgi:integrase